MEESVMDYPTSPKNVTSVNPRRHLNTTGEGKKWSNFIGELRPPQVTTARIEYEEA